jgi:hypothetical protein
MRPEAMARFLEACPPPGDDDGTPIDVSDPDTHDDYQPYGNQIAFHESTAKYRWLRGGLGSGKSHAIIKEAFYHAVLPERLGGIQHVSLIASQTFPHLRDNMLPVLRKAFHPSCLKGGSFEKAYNQQSKILTLKNGTYFALRTAHNGAFQAWRGPEFANVIMDEGRNFRGREPWTVAIPRCRYPGVPPALLQSWMGSTTNGYDWMWDEWFGKYKTEKHAEFLLLTKDNPHLPEDYYENQLAMLDEDEARQELWGEFIARQGAVFSEISDELWPAGNLYELEVDPEHPTDIQIDFGYRSPRVLFVQTHQVLNPLTSTYQHVDVIVREWITANGKPPANKTIGDMIEWLREQKANRWNLRRIFCDPAGDAANDQDHATSVDQLWTAMKLHPIYPRKPWQRSKRTGEATVRARIRNAKGERMLTWGCDPRGEPYAPNCLASHRNLQFPDDRDGQPEKDISKKDGVSDHDTDANRYRVVLVHGKQRRSMAASQVQGLIA